MQRGRARTRHVSDSSRKPLRSRCPQRVWVSPVAFTLCVPSREAPCAGRTAGWVLVRDKGARAHVCPLLHGLCWWSPAQLQLHTLPLHLLCPVVLLASSGARRGDLLCDKSGLEAVEEIVS